MTKITLFLVFALSLQTFATATAQRITLKVEGATLNEVMIEVYRQSGYSFLSDRQLLRKSKPVNLDLRDVDVREALAKIFETQPFSYELSEKIVTAKDLPVRIDLDGNNRTGTTVIMVVMPDVRGRVTDSLGNPLEGATIRALMPDERTAILRNGVAIQAATDANGRFHLQNVPDDAVLEISYMGYDRQITKVRADLGTIILQATMTSVAEIVVTGLFERPKEMYTGAARSFNQEELTSVSSDNILTALRSLDPSFQIPENINLGSNPNALPEVTLRGGNSLVDPNVTASTPFNYANSPNTPLFIMDGFEVSLSRVNDMDITRIRSVDILKDATATSIYGSRAANGVIVIETIRPKPGRLNVTYTGNTTLEAPDLTDYDVLNAAEKLALEDRIGVYDFSWNSRDQQLKTIYNARRSAVLSGVNTDWLAQPVRTGVGHKHSVYLDGGADAVQYGVNVTYFGTAGAMKGSDRETLTGNTILSYRFNNLLFKNDLTLISNRANNSPFGSFRRYTRLNPYWTPFNSDGSYKIYLEEIYDEDTGRRLTNFDTYENMTGYSGRPTNPLYDASLSIKDQSRYNSIINNFSAEWAPYAWLRFRATFAYLYQADEADRFLPAQHSSFTDVTTFEKGSYDKTYGKNQRYEGVFSTNFNRSFGKNMIFATLGGNISQDDSYTEAFRVVGFPNATMDNLTQGLQFESGTRPVGTENIRRLAGMFSNASYSYDNRYLLDFSFRLDGSSQFGSQNRFAPFWSAGAGWNLHNESFVSELGFVDNFRARYSFGYTGSQNFDSFYGITTSRYFNATEYRGMIGTYLLAFGNNALAWQKTQKNNLGVDLQLFRRFSLSANYYLEKTEGSIASISTAPSTGFNDYKENMGDLETRGWELYTKFDILSPTQSRDHWAVFLNLFSVKNQIKRVSNTIAALNRAADEELSSVPITRYAEGQSTTAIWAVPSLGIDPASGYEIFLTREGTITNTYNPLDQIIVGDTRSDVEGTFGTNFEYSGIGLNAFMRFRVGGQAYNQTLADRVENVNATLYNVDRRVSEDRWMGQGDHSFFKALLDPDGFRITEPTYATSRFVQRNDVLSLESISLYYRFDNELVKRWGMHNTKISVYSNDVFRFSTIRQERGLDYPFARSFTLQVSTSF